MYFGPNSTLFFAVAVEKNEESSAAGEIIFTRVSVLCANTQEITNSAAVAAAVVVAVAAAVVAAVAADDDAVAAVAAVAVSV